MKRIAYILGMFPVYSETFILREILELKRKGFKVLVMARMNTQKHQLISEVIHAEAEKLMKEVYYFPELGTEMSRIQKALFHLYFLLFNPIRYLKTFFFSYRTDKETFWFFKNMVFYAMKLKRERVEHIHAHFAVDSCKFAMLISMLSGIPYSFTVHAHDIFLPEYSDLMVEKFNHSKFVVCISEYNKEYVLKHYPGINPEKTRIIHCGLDLGTFIPRDKGRNKVFTIISVGRLVEHKGFKYLIHACKILKERKGFDFVCHIIGGGKQRQELEEVIQKFNLIDVVHLLGAMEQTAILKALNEADLFVLPCIIEKTGNRDGIPVVLMEAMAMKTPVVSTRVSGIPEVVKDGAGILVEPEDVNGLVMAIDKVFNLSEQERQDMGKKGRTIIEKEFDLTKEVQKLG